MNILLDTNILIPLEDTSKILDPSFAEMCKLCNEQKHSLYIHPMQNEDIKRDKDEKRRNIVLSRLKQYILIENPPILTDEILLKLDLTQSNDNDKVDNNILYALYRGAVNILVTNDEGIHKKSAKIGIKEKVYRLNQFLLLLKKYSNKPINKSYTGVREKYLYEIDKTQSFFDSLRKTYNGFDNWYQKIAEEKRKCWCIEDNNEVLAICIYKIEENEKLTDDGEPIKGKILKLCTFKVDAKARGKKLGERLFYIAFDYCVKNNIDWVYLHTVGSEQQSLVGLCEDYGFYFLGKYKNDDVYIKSMKYQENDLPSLESLIRYYPYFKDDENVQKFIIPIQPKFHEELFPDYSNLKGSLFEGEQNLCFSQGNTIKKAYLCHAKIKTLKKGDIILFYRSDDRKSIQCMGIIEDVFFSDNIDEVFSIVSKRTVYNLDELKEKLKQKTLIILFRYIGLNKEIHFNNISKVGIKGNIQTIRKITNQQYTELLK